MLKEAIEAIAGIVRAEEVIQPWQRYELENDTIVHVKSDGETLTIEKPFPHRKYEFGDVDSFCSAVLQYGTTAAVFVDDEKVRCICDNDAYARDMLTLELERSQLFTSILGWPKTFKQRELIRFLRQFMPSDMPFLAAIRQIDFARSSTGKATKEHGRETLGSSVEMVVQGRDEIPDKFFVNVRPYQIGGFKVAYPIEIVVEIDVEEQAFWLCPAADEIKTLEMAARSDIVDLLRGYLGDVPVFIGEA